MESICLLVQAPCESFLSQTASSSFKLGSQKIFSCAISRRGIFPSHPVSCKASASNQHFDFVSLNPSLASAAPAAQRGGDADVMGLLLRQRIVFLGSELNDYVADSIVSQLLLLDAQDSTQDIRLFINCPGGSISSAMAVYDAIQLCRADVSTIAFGLVASTASLLLAGGSKGKRFAMPNTRVMIHQPLGGASGQAIDVEIQAKEIMYHKNNITRIFSEVTNRPFSQVEKDIDRDRYMSPLEAMEYGILDGVIDRNSIIPLVPSTTKAKPRREYLEAEKDFKKFLIPTIPDSEIF